jgi:hypothetical protein
MQWFDKTWVCDKPAKATGAAVGFRRRLHGMSGVSFTALDMAQDRSRMPV